MIKKVMIEAKDYTKIIKWKDDTRFNKFVHKLNELTEDKENIYVLGIDISDSESKDNGMMVQFRIVDGKYIYEGSEII